MNKEMWQMRQADGADSLDLLIYGDVEEKDFWTGEQSENSAKHFAEALQAAGDVKQINIYINSYGGSVMEGTAIYNQLKRHSAHKSVYVDGFACSIASVIAMAGDEVVMPKNAMMMIHRPWMFAVGNAKELRKAADDLDKIGEAGKQAYLQKAGEKLEEKQLDRLMDAESWLTADDCVECGLADRIAGNVEDIEEKAKVIPQEAMQKCSFNLLQILKMRQDADSEIKGCEEESSPEKEKPLTIFEKMRKGEKEDEIK